MLIKDTKSNVLPSAVLMDENEDGSKIVRMAGEATEEAGEDGQTIYTYDEVLLPWKRGGQRLSPTSRRSLMTGGSTEASRKSRCRRWSSGWPCWRITLFRGVSCDDVPDH